MTHPTTSSTLTAACAHCGGSVSLALAGPEPSCHFCGNTHPLQPDVQARVQTMRARLGQRSAKQRQLTGELVSTAGLASFMHISILVTCWVLFGGMAFGFAVYGHEIDFLTFAKGPPPEADLSGEWWVLFELAVIFPLSLGLWGLTLFRLRGLSAEALPLPPAYPGAPPRCRCCGADLPDGTALRRCVYCQADNMVTGERYRRSELDLDRALDRISKSFERSLESRMESAGKAMMVSAMAPIALLLLAPIGLLVGVTMPELWPIAGASAVLGAIGLVLPLTRKLPKIEPLSCVALDTKLSVGGQAQQVNGQLFVPVEGQPRRVYSLIGDEWRSLELSMYVETGPERDPVVVHKLTRGGQPLVAEEQSRLEQVELWLRDRAASGGLRVEGVHLVRHGKGGFRLWQGNPPVAGVVPTWTANRMKDRPIIFFP